MTSDTELVDRIREAGESILVGDPPVERLIRKGRRRLVRRLAGLAASIIVVGGGLSWAIVALSGLSGPDSRPTIAPGAIVRILVGGRPIRHMAVGYGAAWVIVQTNGHGPVDLERIDAKTNRVSVVDTLGEPQSVEVGSGSVWVASCRNGGRGLCRGASVLSRLDPATGAVEATTDVRGSLGQVAVGEGAVWVPVFQNGTWSLLRIDPRSNKVVARITGCCAFDVAVGARAVWGEGDSGDLVLRVDPETNAVARKVFIGAHLGHVVTVGEGGLWIKAEPPFLSTPLRRIDPKTGEVLATFPSMGNAEGATGYGFVWIAGCKLSSPAEAVGPTSSAPTRGPSRRCIQVLRIDPNSNSIVGPSILVAPGPLRFPLLGISFGPSFSIGVGEDSVWLGVDESGEVIRIGLRR